MERPLDSHCEAARKSAQGPTAHHYLCPKPAGTARNGGKARHGKASRSSPSFRHKAKASKDPTPIEPTRGYSEDISGLKKSQTSQACVALVFMSITKGASGPTRTATAPQPPVGRAGPWREREGGGGRREGGRGDEVRKKKT